MANWVRFYTMAFEDQEGVVNHRSILRFLNSIEQILDRNLQNVIRPIEGRNMRIFKYFRDPVNPNARFVIPFGQRKLGSVYGEGQDDGGATLETINRTLYDVNLIYINSRMNAILATGDQSGPKVRFIEQYLNSYIDDEYKIKIRPIYYNTGIEKIRNAQQVRSVTFSLDFGCDNNLFYNQQTQATGEGIIDNFIQFLDTTRNNLDNQTIQITLGMGRRKNTTMDINSLVHLLEQINIDSDCVREIVATYKDGTEDRISPAKLKNQSIHLQHTFSINQSDIAPEYLNLHGDEALNGKAARYAERVREYYRDAVAANEDYNLVELTE